MKIVIMPFIIYTLLLQAVFAQLHNDNSTSNFDITSEQWQADLAFLKDHAPMIHKNLFNKMSRSGYESYINKLNMDIPTLTSNQVYARMMKLVAMFGDGHTTLQASTAEFYPIRYYVFADGIFVLDAEDTELIGKKLISINGMPAEKVYEMLTPYVAHDNEWQIKGMIPLYMSNARLLNGIGLADGDKKINIMLSDRSGNVISKELSPIPHDQFRAYMPYSYGPLNKKPLYLQNTDKNYWYEYLPDTKTLYFKYSVVQQDRSDPISKFIERMAETVENNEIDRFIIDVRNNGGGNNFTSIAFSDFISNNLKINQKGKLFLIIDRKTFSAASFFTSSIENKTSAIIVGEPTGASPNHYGDAVGINLPNSGLTVRLSTILWQNSFPWDERESTNPDVLIELSSDDYFSGKDPLLEAIQAYKYSPGNEYELTNDGMKVIEGRYHYSDEEVLEIYSENGKPYLRITDILGISFTDFIKTRLYPFNEHKFITDISGVELSPDLIKGEYVTLKAQGREIRIDRDDDYKVAAELFFDGDFEKAISIYKNLKQSGSNRKLLNEVVINQVGYTLLREKKFDPAIALFKLNTEFYPNSSNVYDSLGEAYMLKGDKELAIANFQRSLNLDPGNVNAVQMINKLKSE